MKNEDHVCRRFKTTFKRNKVRMKVACRECGVERVVGFPHKKLATPVGVLPK